MNCGFLILQSDTPTNAGKRDILVPWNAELVSDEFGTKNIKISRNMQKGLQKVDYHLSHVAWCISASLTTVLHTGK